MVVRPLHCMMTSCFRRIFCRVVKALRHPFGWLLGYEAALGACGSVMRLKAVPRVDHASLHLYKGVTLAVKLRDL